MGNRRLYFVQRFESFYKPRTVSDRLRYIAGVSELQILPTQNGLHQFTMKSEHNEAFLILRNI